MSLKCQNCDFNYFGSRHTAFNDIQLGWQIDFNHFLNGYVELHFPIKDQPNVNRYKTDTKMRWTLFYCRFGMGFFSYSVLVRWISFYNLSLNALNRNYVGIQLGSVKYFAIEWYENPIDFWCPREVENVIFVEKINLSVSKAAATIIALWIFEFSWIRFSIFFYSILSPIALGIQLNR